MKLLLPWPCRLLTGLLVLVFQVGVADAGKAEQTLQAFFSDLRTLQADFHQQVIGSDNVLQQETSGRLWIQRPGRFRWNYEAPYRQQIVADGERIWTYDEDLDQVTVQPLTEVLGSTPAMLLSGGQPLDEVFHLEELPPEQGATKVRLTPVSAAENIIDLQLYFTAGQLTRIDAKDSLGNTTLFRFSALERNIALDHALFKFDIPAGADVVGNFDLSPQH